MRYKWIMSAVFVTANALFPVAAFADGELTFICVVSPGGTSTPTGCRSVLPGFSFSVEFTSGRGHFVGSAPNYFWQIASVQGPPPTISEGCNPYTYWCDLSLTTNATGDTVVDVQLTYLPWQYTGSARVRVPCTTIKPPNHPTTCS